MLAVCDTCSHKGVPVVNNKQNLCVCFSNFTRADLGELIIHIEVQKMLKINFKCIFFIYV